MTALATQSSPTSEPQSLLLPPHQSDTALHAHLSLGSSPLVGSHKYLGVEIAAQNPALASSLAREARRMEKSGDTAKAIEYLTRAIHLDQASALNRTWLVRRALLIESGGGSAPIRAIELYDIGCTLKQLKLWGEAERAYDGAARLDRAFLWPANNVSWMLAMAAHERTHNASKAVLAAEWACHQSGFGYWGFLGTLAAAFARNGDFERAVAWQQVSLRLTPEAHHEDALRELESYRCREPWIDNDEEPAAGERTDAERLSKVDVPELLARAAALGGGHPARVH